MGNVDTHRQTIQAVLQEYLRIVSSDRRLQRLCVFDRDGDHYLLVCMGWQGVKRIHGCLIHIDLIDGKVWIQRDGTEHGIANDLLAAGIPKDRIVLGFHAPNVRPHTEFAVA